MKRILIIDDEEMVRSMLRMTLERAGYDIMDAPDGKVGTNLFLAEPPDLIITDILMPEKDGLETMMDIRDHFPETRIIAISGGGRFNSPQVLLNMAESFGAERVFSKPVNREELLAAVKELIGESVNVKS